jgi:response regulator NasT
MSSIIVANSNPNYAKRIAALFRSSGLYVGGVCVSGAQLMDFAHRHYLGGVAVCSVKLKDMMTVNLPHMIGQSYDFVYLVSPNFAGICSSLNATSLIMPINRVNLLSTVNMFLNLAEHTPMAIKKQIDSGAVDEKRTILKAKNLLITRNNLTEPQAHRLIQKKSMDTGRKMAETAMIILNS